MMSPILHVVFTETGAADLREALKTSGRDDAVVSLADNLSFGPIDPADPEARRTWVEKELGFTGWPSTPEQDGDNGWEDISVRAHAFWNESLSPRHRKIAWISCLSAMEYAGFLEWLWRLGDAPCEVIDLSDVKISYRREHGPPRRPLLAMSLGMLDHNTIGNNDLWDLAEPLQMSARGRYLDLWRQLRSENAPLRVIDGDKLVSAPIDFFDPLLLSYVNANWQKVAMVVGKALTDQTMDGVFQTGVIVLAARINSLVKSRALEFKGWDPFAIRFGEVRLPQP
jgi:Protein of unknown function/Domain of unknown function (DUF1835)